MHNAGRAPFAMPDDVEALARQYWSTWAEAMRGGAGAPRHDAPQPWQQPMDWWTTLAKGGRHGADDVLGRFNGQAQQWLSTMQQVAAQFAGRDAGAADIASAWRQALGGASGMGGMHGLGGFGAMPDIGVAGFPGMAGLGGGANPFSALMQGMQQGPGLHGFDHWMQQVGPWLNAVQQSTATMPAQATMPEMPTFGFTRERDERWQRLARDQADLQSRLQAYGALMTQATQDAFGVFEGKLAEHEEPGRQLGSARALFDLWIDAAEQAYAKIALSPEFRTVYGELVNAQMRVRAGVQREVEHACEQVGMPTRTELDGAHRKIVELERQVRRLRDGAASSAPRRSERSSAEVADMPAASTRKVVAKVPRRKAATRKAAQTKPSASRTVKKAATKLAKTAVKKPAKKTSKKSARKIARKAKASRTARAAAAPVVRQSAAPVGASPSASRRPRKVKQPKAPSPSRARSRVGKKTSRRPAKASRAARATAAVKRGPLPIFAHVSMPMTPAVTSRKAR